MSNTILITANWTTGALSQQTISRQYDNNRYAVQFIGYPEGDGTEELDLYLLVWMSTAPGQKPGEITPIQLNSDQWYISNYFTQQVQVIKFQLCVLNEAGTYEAHSPIFSGRIGDSLEHNGTSHDIDVSTLFDAYREYLNELIIGAGAMIIDPTPTQGSNNVVSSGGVYSALAGKVDVETGKGLSTNDYSDVEKQKVTDATADLSAITTATAEDAGKALKAKTVVDGKVTEWEFGEAGGGDISALETLVDSMNNFGTTEVEENLTSEITPNIIYATSGTVGGTASLTAGSNSNYASAYWSVTQGDQFKITGKGGDSNTGSRLYCFTDVNLKVLALAEKNEQLSAEVLTAPADGYLLVGFKKTTAYSVIKRVNETITLHDKVDNVDDDISALGTELNDYISDVPKWYAQNIMSASSENWTDVEKMVTGAGDKNSIVTADGTISINNYVVGDVIYFSGTVKAGGTPNALRLTRASSSTESERCAIVENPTPNEWYKLSAIRRANINNAFRYISASVEYADETAQTGQTLIYKCGIALNLTLLFGAGNEPNDATIIDAMLARYADGWFAGTQDIWNPSIIKWLAEGYKTFYNGVFYGPYGDRFVAGSGISGNDSQWNHAQSYYGIDKNIVPIDNSFEGGIRTNGMINVFPKYGRWEYGAYGADSGSLFGGHVFEAWNNLRSYRLTMMMGHGGDTISYTDENEVVHSTSREDEACIIVYSPANSYSNPPVTPSEKQSHLRITKAREDYYQESPQAMLGRVRVGGDRADQGTVFTKNKMITYGRMILADTTQENKGKALKFNSDGTVTWEEVTLYQNPEPAPVNE